MPDPAGSGIHYRHSPYLETNVEVGVAGDKVVSLRFTDSPQGEENGAPVLDEVFQYLDGDEVDFSGYDVGLTLGGLERRALLKTQRIPYGDTVTYEEFAASLGEKDGVEEVRETVDNNPVAVLLPSHRVVEEDGLGGFTGPREVKRKLLDIEGGI